jgi:hypothetical protein
MRQPRRFETPLGALGSGLLAGLAGTAATGAFMTATRRLAPSLPPGRFTPPEPEQAHELPTETMARRLVEGQAHRGPLGPVRKRRLGRLLQLGFGARWGVLYGLLRESFPVLRGPAGALGLGAVAWLVSEELLLPAFRLAPPPRARPARLHLYGLASHLVFGLAAGLTAGLVERAAQRRRAK